MISFWRQMITAHTFYCYKQKRKARCRQLYVRTINWDRKIKQEVGTAF